MTAPRPRRWMAALVCALASILGLAGAARAVDQPLLVDLSRPRVSITSAFRGADVLVFGAIDGPGDVILTVTGATTRQTILRKERILGLWINAGRQAFEEVPSYYAVAATRSLDAILPPGGLPGVPVTLDERLAGLRPPRDAPRRTPLDLTDFRQGLIDAKRRAGLFPTETQRVTLVGGRLFRAEMRFPSRLPIGSYEVRAYVVRDGVAVSAVSRTLEVSKAGFSARVSEWSKGQAPLYGVAAILGALVIGWVAGAVARRL